MDDLDYVISMLIGGGDNLPKRFKNHKLKGKYSGAMECHIDFDWILVYRYDYSKLILYAMVEANSSEQRRLLDDAACAIGYLPSERAPA